ncbi:MAG: hypothetical protein IEMM0007_2013 [bacterium]|nr:MAG: hypothetical protein IEMM0007_2013 [bacterium]
MIYTKDHKTVNIFDPFDYLESVYKVEQLSFSVISRKRSGNRSIIRIPDSLHLRE